ncbi:MAG: transcriptional repressor LexA [Clostridiales bacterium]|jgi:repressor LexA|nr:transcriptional repressor LexA [Clostridiales bacterium]
MLNEMALNIYNYIKERIEEGIPPTIREICTDLNIKSTSTVHKYISILTEMGYLEKIDNQNRAIKLKGYNSSTVPLIGTVTAGVPITAIENITDYIPWTKNKNYSNPLFALKIRGDSMINAGIQNDDIVIVEQVPTVENGDIVVALINSEEATVKRFFKEKGKIRLQPENNQMEPIIVDNADILGKVIALLRYL